MISPSWPPSRAARSSSWPGMSMSIQFRCTHCAQPIEVDDEHAGREAQCPYCQEVARVPAESTYRALAGANGPAAGPRPADTHGPAGPQPLAAAPTAAPYPPPPMSPRAARERTAITYGNYALVCAGITAILFLLFFALAFAVGMQAMGKAQGQPLDF